MPPMIQMTQTISQNVSHPLWPKRKETPHLPLGKEISVVEATDWKFILVVWNNWLKELVERIGWKNWLKELVGGGIIPYGRKNCPTEREHFNRLEMLILYLGGHFPWYCLHRHTFHPEGFISSRISKLSPALPKSNIAPLYNWGSKSFRLIT